MGNPRPDPAAEHEHRPAPGEGGRAGDPAEEVAELRSKNARLLAEIDELKSLASTAQGRPGDLQRLHLLQIQPVRDVLVILLILGIFWLGYVLRPITIPIMLALGLAYLVEPVVSRVTRRGWMSRPGAAVLVILSVVLVILVPIVVGGTFATMQGIEYGSQFREQVRALRNSVNDPEDAGLAMKVKEQGRFWQLTRDFIVEARTPAPAPAPIPEGAADPATPGAGTGPAAPEQPAPPADAGGTGRVLAADVKTADEQTARAGTASAPLSTQIVMWLDDMVQRSGGSLGEVFGQRVLGTGGDVARAGIRLVGGIFWFFFSLFLVLFFFFFFSIQWGRVTAKLGELIPRRKKDRTVSMLRQMDAVISGFIRGRLTIMLILMALFAIGYWLIGVPAPLIVGLLVGVLAIIPYAGLFSIPICWLLMWMQPGGFADWQQTWWWILAAPVALYSLIQMVDDYILTPVIQGKATDMDTPTILFAVMAGGILLGFYGMLLAVPIAACVKILIRESFWPRFTAWAEGRLKDFLPISRYDPTEVGRR